MDLETKKPSYDEWMYWTQVVIDRLTAIAHVYGHPPYPDVFMADKERQDKMARTLAAMRYLHELTDAFELSLPQDATDTPDREEDLLEKLYPAFQEILTMLPDWSTDMQYLLKSHWSKDCIGRVAQTLFLGPAGRKNEGIGSGLPENGRLPEVIHNLIEREMSGDTRTARIQKPSKAPQRMRRHELARLYERQNTTILSSAGGMD